MSDKKAYNSGMTVTNLVTRLRDGNIGLAHKEKFSLWISADSLAMLRALSEFYKVRQTGLAREVLEATLLEMWARVPPDELTQLQTIYERIKGEM